MRVDLANVAQGPARPPVANCKFTEPIEGEPNKLFKRCPKCGAIGIDSHHLKCGALPDFDIREIPEFQNGFFVSVEHKGPGTELLKRFHRWGLPACQACFKLAREMDGWGVSGCLERVEEIADRIIENTKRHPALDKKITKASKGELLVKAIGLAPDGLKRLAVKRLVNEAIEAARALNADDNSSGSDL